MEAFLGKITQHAMSYAIRSGIALTSSYAINQCSRLLKNVNDTKDFDEIRDLQERLDSKIKIISPAINMIELISARGNTTLESALSLTKALRWDIQLLGTRLAKAANAEESAKRSKSTNKSRSQFDAELQLIVHDMRKLLTNVEDAVPLINLAIATSGVNLSTSLPPTVSASRLLQASTCLTAGDNQFSKNPNIPVQVGPAFTLSVYMLFAGGIPRTGEKSVMKWNEAIHKARVRLVRVPLIATYGIMADFGAADDKNMGKNETLFQSIENSGAGEFAYQLEVIEDLDDDRFHSYEADEPQPQPFNGVQLAGIRENIPIHEISKIFYADTSKMLNLSADGEANNPVLLLKRDNTARPPSRMMDHFERYSEWPEDPEEPSQKDIQTDLKTRHEPEPDESQADIDAQLREESSFLELKQDAEEERNIALQSAELWHLSPSLDSEWIAFEVYTEFKDDSSEDGDDESGPDVHLQSDNQHRESSVDIDLNHSMANLNVKAASPAVVTSRRGTLGSPQPPIDSISSPPAYGPVRTSLSLLEMLIRLTSMQQFQQASHLAIPDEILNFFLMDSSTSGAGSDVNLRRRTRNEAKEKVGFDPYDQSPVKRRSHNYEDQDTTDERNDAHHTHKRYSPGVEHDDDERDWSRQQSPLPQNTPQSWLLRNKDGSSTTSHRHAIPSSSPRSPNMVPRKATKPLVQRRGLSVSVSGSPLGNGRSVGTDSSLGTSPGTPTLGGLIERGEEP